MKGVSKTGPVLTPLSSLPVPPHPNTEVESDHKPTNSFNAFSFLMSRNKENEAWKEATEAETSKWGKFKQKGKGKGSVKAKAEVKEEVLVEKEEEIEEVGDDEEMKVIKSTKGTEGGDTARRAAPFYKVMQGMPIAVDAFRYGRIPGVTAYLLTYAS